jgi:hypothetical protein
MTVKVYYLDAQTHTSGYRGSWELAVTREFLKGIYQEAWRLMRDPPSEPAVYYEMDNEVYQRWCGRKLTDIEYVRYCGIPIA